MYCDVEGDAASVLVKRVVELAVVTGLYCVEAAGVAVGVAASDDVAEAVAVVEKLGMCAVLMESVAAAGNDAVGVAGQETDAADLSSGLNLPDLHDLLL